MTLNAFLRQTLPWIDEGLSKSGKPLPERALTAAQFIVEHLVHEVEGGLTDAYLEKPWFASIYQATEQWFRAKYGGNLLRAPRSDARGLVEYQGLLLLLRVPLVIAEPTEDTTLWLTFPKEVLAGEDPISWMENAPPLEAMPTKRRLALTAECTCVASQLRGIQNDLLSAGSDWPRPDALRASVLRHLGKAAIDATAGELEALSPSVWELQMACEMTMKGFLAQQQVPYPETHDLRQLHKLAATDTTWNEAKAALGFMPVVPRVMRLRYSEVPPPTPREFMRMYKAALTICRLYAARMSRKYVFNNFAVHLSCPPWFGEAPPIKLKLAGKGEHET